MAEPTMTIALTQTQVQNLLNDMAADIREKLADKQPLLVGIHTGGVWVAKALQDKIHG